MSAESELRCCPLPGNFDRWQDLLGLIHDSFAYMDGVIDPPSSALRLTAESLKEKCAGETAFVVLSGDRLVGCVFLADRDDHLYLGKLAVAPDHQGRGVGRRLVAIAEEYARGLGKGWIELQTRVELASIHIVLARLGFHEMGRTAHPGYDRATSLTMRKEFETGT